MARSDPSEAPSFSLNPGAIVAGCLCLIAVLAATAAIYEDPGEMLTRNTVRLSLAWYAAALCLMMRLTRGDWRAESTFGRVARWCWTWAVVVFLVHLAMAFHFYHHWSHTHAFEHTREVSGVGEGIYTSYLFTWLWVGDALWWWVSPASYATRSGWFDRALHAFMLFIVFNGTIVFESGLIRWAGVAMFALFGVSWVLARQAPRLHVA